MIAVLAGVVGIGAIFVFHKPHNSNAADKTPDAGAAASELASSSGNNGAVLVVAKSDKPAVADSAVIKKPASAPPPSLVANAPATRPSVNLTAIGSASGGTSSDSSPQATLATGKALADAGKLIQAREQINDSLNSGRLSEADNAAAKSALSQINQTVVFSKQIYADDPFAGPHTVGRGESLAKIATADNVTWELLARINGIDAKKLRASSTIKTIHGPFFCVVTKHSFTMDLYLGSLPGEKGAMYVTSYPVGLGKDDSTPTGTWMIEPHRKIKHPTYYSPRGEGVIGPEDPKNPLGDYWLGLAGVDGHAVGQQSYGIHGTIEPDSIGKQSSMGCIRMRNEDVAVVYELLVEGKSMVVVKD
jgi:lipoprotein-anchoring transpeptidase ErfK/SrfK